MEEGVGVTTITTVAILGAVCHTQKKNTTIYPSNVWDDGLASRRTASRTRSAEASVITFPPALSHYSRPAGTTTRNSRSSFLAGTLPPLHNLRLPAYRSRFPLSSTLAENHEFSHQRPTCILHSAHREFSGKILLQLCGWIDLPRCVCSGAVLGGGQTLRFRLPVRYS